MKEWGRIITAMVTAFDDDLNINYDEVVRHAKRLENEGSGAILVNGTTGESPTLSGKEVADLIRTVKENVTIPVIAGVGTNSTKRTIENIRNISSCNADGLLVIVPYYNKPNQKSIYAHFYEVARNTDLPIMMYNVPGRTGVNMSIETLAGLAEIDNIVSIKEASGDTAQLTRMVRVTPEDFSVYTGDDILTLPSLAVGAYGVVSVASNIAGLKMEQMIYEYFIGNYNEAIKINLELTPLFDCLFATTSPIPIKAAMNLSGLNAGGCRLPLTDASDEIKDLIKKCLKDLNLRGSICHE